MRCRVYKYNVCKTNATEDHFEVQVKVRILKFKTVAIALKES